MSISTDLETSYSAHIKYVVEQYQNALEKEDADGVVIASGSLKYAFLDDHSYPFTVNPHFKYCLPLTGVPESFVILRPGEKPRLLLHQPQDYWHATAETPTDYWASEWDIQPIASPEEASNFFGDPSSMVFVGEEEAAAKEMGFNLCNPEALMNQVHFTRAYKTDYELACMQRANDIAVSGHIAAENRFKQGASEFDIQHAYLAATQHREQQAPYGGIVALNEHCAVLHYQHYDLTPPAFHHSLLIDAGAEFNGYAADITRTYAARPGLFADLITAMDEAQLDLIDNIKTGNNYADLHLDMHKRLAAILKDFKFVDASVDAMLETNLTFTFLPHGLGHLLGLQTHDIGGFQQTPAGDTKAAPDNYPALRLTRPIEDRQVFTIEPGLYFIPMLLAELKNTSQKQWVNWTLIEDCMSYGGIRIEDNIAMIDGKPVNMTREAFANA